MMSLSSSTPAAKYFLGQYRRDVRLLLSPNSFSKDTHILIGSNRLLRLAGIKGFVEKFDDLFCSEPGHRILRDWCRSPCSTTRESLFELGPVLFEAGSVLAAFSEVVLLLNIEERPEKLLCAEARRSVAGQRLRKSFWS